MKSFFGISGVRAALLVTLGASVSLTGCGMTPEDKAFYGRGWINPDELDQDTPPPRSFTEPTAGSQPPAPPAEPMPADGTETGWMPAGGN